MRPRALGNKRAWNAIPAIAIVAALGSGCGFVFSEGPPASYQRRLHFDCGESVAPPVVDSVATGLFALATAGAAGTSSSSLRGDEKATLVSVYGGLALLLAASAVYGYDASAACRAAKAERTADWIRAQAWAAAGAR